MCSVPGRTLAATIKAKPMLAELFYFPFTRRAHEILFCATLSTLSSHRTVTTPYSVESFVLTSRGLGCLVLTSQAEQPGRGARDRTACLARHPLFLRSQRCLVAHSQARDRLLLFPPSRAQRSCQRRLEFLETVNGLLENTDRGVSTDT